MMTRHSRTSIFLCARGYWKTSRYQLLTWYIGIRLMETNVVWFFSFPSHNQNERKVRDMVSYDIKAIILDNHAEGLLLKGLAKQMGLAVLTRLVAPEPNLWTGLEVSCFFKPYSIAPPPPLSFFSITLRAFEITFWNLEAFPKI